MRLGQRFFCSIDCTSVFLLYDVALLVRAVMFDVLTFALCHTCLHVFVYCLHKQGVATSVQRALQLIAAAQSAVTETDDDSVSAQLATANDRSTPSSSSHSSNGSSSVAAAAVRAVTDALRAAEEAESALIKTQSHQVLLTVVIILTTPLIVRPSLSVMVVICMCTVQLV
jgi:predicted ATP-dependent Lon-type protease